jgi:UDP-glucuronate decarboxylase
MIFHYLLSSLSFVVLLVTVSSTLTWPSNFNKVYGDPEVHPQKETYWGHVNPIGPRACYDEGKRVAETMMYAYESQAKVEVRVARIFNTFGPRMHPNDGRVVSNFIIQVFMFICIFLCFCIFILHVHMYTCIYICTYVYIDMYLYAYIYWYIQALQGKDITIYGTGLQTRSFQYVDDLVEGLIRLMNGNYSQPVNIGNPDEYTVKDFANMVKEITKSNSTIQGMYINVYTYL